MNNSQASVVSERLAVKSVCASDILQNVFSTANELDVLYKKLTRYISQIQLLLTWRRGSAAMKIAGSAAKTVASLMVLAAPLHPNLRMALNVGQKFWKLGVGLKVLNAVADIVRDMWQDGCRQCLLDFTRCAATMSRNLGVFGEVINDLQGTVNGVNPESSLSLNTPRQLFNLIKQFIPQAQHIYAAHVSSIVFGGERYSPIFDFIALMSDPTNQSPTMQLLRELESLNFTEFVAESDSKPMVAVSSLLHISRELLDFLDGFHQFTNRDCTFLQECLIKFTQESQSILKVVSVLVNLKSSNLRKEITDETASLPTTCTNQSSQTPTFNSKNSQREEMEEEISNKVSQSETATGYECNQKINVVEATVGMSCDEPLNSNSNQTSPPQLSEHHNANAHSKMKNANELEIGQDPKEHILTKAFSSLSGLMKRSSSAVLAVSSSQLNKFKQTKDNENADNPSQFQLRDGEEDKTRI